MPALARIKAKLERLRALDPDLQQFGALSHEYRLGPTLSEPEIQALEHQLGVTLPADYRQFLAEVGHGGAGPYYGLLQLDDGDDSMSFIHLGNPSKPFLWSEPFDTEELEEMPGALYFCEYGCGLFFFLVVNGVSKGEIWHDWQANSKGFYPAVGRDGRRLGFLEWYEEWLDRSLASIESP